MTISFNVFFSFLSTCLYQRRTHLDEKRQEIGKIQSDHEAYLKEITEEHQKAERTLAGLQGLEPRVNHLEEAVTRGLAQEREDARAKSDAEAALRECLQEVNDLIRRAGSAMGADAVAQFDRDCASILAKGDGLLGTLETVNKRLEDPVEKTVSLIFCAL